MYQDCYRESEPMDQQEARKHFSQGTAERHGGAGDAKYSAMKTALVALGSALTLVGGHLANRRWDRAVLFFLLLAGLLSLGTGPVMLDTQWELSSARQLFIGLLLGLWLVGLLFAVYDARRPDELRRPAWSITGGLAATVLTVSSIMLLVGMFLMLGNSNVPATASKVGGTGVPGTKRHSYTRVGDYFSHFVYYGPVDDITAEYPEPPAGKGRLVGRVLYEGTPAAGVVLRLFLNGEYRSLPVTTDENGRFTLAIQPGTWNIDALVTESWPDQPAEQLVPLTGDELNLGNATSFDWSPGRPARRVEVPAGGEPSNELLLRFRNPVTLAWPGEYRQTAEYDDTIRWNAYPEAQTYRIALHSVTRRADGSASFKSSSSQVLNATELPLETLQSIPTPGEEHEYSVTVFAFDGEGKPLSRTGGFVRDTFVLHDYRLIGESETRSLGSASPTAKDLEQLVSNAQRLDAVKLLIDEELPQAAEALLKKVEGPTPPGRREALTAYLRAEQGRCEEARQWAQRARENNADCLLDKLAACEGSSPAPHRN